MNRNRFDVRIWWIAGQDRIRQLVMKEHLRKTNNYQNNPSIHREMNHPEVPRKEKLPCRTEKNHPTKQKMRHFLKPNRTWIFQQIDPNNDNKS
jgi:hypothetical protein